MNSGTGGLVNPGRAATSRLARAAAVVGVGHTDWIADWKRVRAGEKPTDSYGYGAIAFREALTDANLKRDDIDGLIVGPTTAYERLSEVLGIDPRWANQADAVLSVINAAAAIELGLAETIALVYGNDQRSAKIQYGGPQAMGGNAYLSYVYHSPWGLTSQGALYALTFRAWSNARLFPPNDLGHVAVAQRAWSSMNPNAIQRKRITIEDYVNAPYICEPLRLFDYCQINDGGVALIVTTAERAKRLGKPPVYIQGFGRRDLNKDATCLGPRLTNFYLPAQQDCASQAYEMAGFGPQDMDMLQVYDSFSVHVPLALEGYGYCKLGDVSRFFREEGIGPGGKLPINTSGGHLSETYMQGWAHQIECVRQLRGECAERQLPNCRHAHYTSDVVGNAVSIIYSR